MRLRITKFTHDWILCGRVEGNNVYVGDILAGRIEIDQNGYRCILDFRDDIRISMNKLEQEYNQCKNMSFDSSTLCEIRLKQIDKLKSHPDEYAVAKTSIRDGLDDKGFTTVFPLTDYILQAEERAGAPEHIRKEWWFEYPVIDMMLCTYSRDSFGLAAVFVCFQRACQVDKQLRPFYDMYP